MIQKDLRLVLETPERGAVDDAVAIALKGWPGRVVVLRVNPATRLA
jgi:hypothetical protein